MTMFVEVFSITYLLALVITVFTVLGTYLFLVKKEKKFQYRYLLVWSFLCFVLHFAKQLVYLDATQLSKSTAENICALSTMIFPFIMLFKKKNILHDFMFFIGVIGGLAGVIYPTEALGESIFTFETIRFYFSHISLLVIPLLLALLGLRVPDLKKWWLIPLCFLGYQFILMLNTALLTFTGMVKREGFTPFELFISRQYLNNSFTFGPTDDMGAVGKFIGNLTLPLMRKDILNINQGKETYWPVIWLLTPSYILLTPLYVLFTLPFNLKKQNKEKTKLVLNAKSNY
ncbi:TMEM164 family acyltransferase [Acholeplasma hippikon]|nr:YwaF family protein [Acholeplasma hippikon]